MARPKNPTPSVDKTICLPAPVVAQVELLLYSPLQERVPHGAWKRYITGLIEADLRQRRPQQRASAEEK